MGLSKRDMLIMSNSWLIVQKCIDYSPGKASNLKVFSSSGPEVNNINSVMTGTWDTKDGENN